MNTQLTMLERPTRPARALLARAGRALLRARALIVALGVLVALAPAAALADPDLPDDAAPRHDDDDEARAEDGDDAAPRHENDDEARAEDGDEADDDDDDDDEPSVEPGVVEEGQATWYGRAYHGQNTASGETFDMHELVAAHDSLPFGTRVRVTALESGREVVVRIIDRTGSRGGAIIDLSRAAAEVLGMIESGRIPVRIETL